VLPLVNDHLTVITSRLRNAREAARRELCALASDLFQLSGEIFFDQNRYTDAAHCYTSPPMPRVKANRRTCGRAP